MKLWERISDIVTDFVGSRRFVFRWSWGMMFWITLQSLIFWNNWFDPFPYILLNLFLSYSAIILASLIMMSQNRRAEKDSNRLKQDLEIDRESVRLLNKLLKNQKN